MKEKEIAVYVFYSVLTWYIGPMIATKVNIDDKILGFFIGFAASIVLYKTMGKKFIDGY